jgi:hypothetical protein
VDLLLCTSYCRCLRYLNLAVISNSRVRISAWDFFFLHAFLFILWNSHPQLIQELIYKMSASLKKSKTVSKFLQPSHISTFQFEISECYAETIFSQLNFVCGLLNQLRMRIW